ncbi:MAG: hypothetical protein J1E04_02300, partial [Alistipes sp.]|nr:hypothetical protein [Alistipes sp.]
THDPQLRRLLLYPTELRDHRICAANVEFLCRFSKSAQPGPNKNRIDYHYFQSVPDCSNAIGL